MTLEFYVTNKEITEEETMIEILNFINFIRKIYSFDLFVLSEYLKLSFYWKTFYSWASYRRDALPLTQDMAINMFPCQHSQYKFIALFIPFTI
jgi:hypothetical protein